MLSLSICLCVSLSFFHCTHVNSVNGIEVSPTVNQICSWLVCCKLQDLEYKNLPAALRYVFNNSLSAFVIFLKGSISEKETKGEVWRDDDCYY